MYKGTIDCSGSPLYPAANAGHIYLVSVAGKIGGGSGLNVTASDMLICKSDSTPSGTQAAVGAYWDVVQGNIDLSNITITGGTINGVTIGGTSAGVITGTTINGTTFDTNNTTQGVTLNGTTLAADGTATNISITITPKGTTGYVVMSKVDIGGGAIDGVVIGGDDAGAGTFTSVTTDTISERNTGVGVTIDGVTLKDGGALDITGGSNTFNLTNGSSSLDVAASSAVDINANLTVGGATTIGAGGFTVEAAGATVNQDTTTDATPTFTGVLATTFDTNVAAAGVTLAGTTLAADGTDAAISITLTPKGTGSVIMSKVDIGGGEVDGTPIGANSASTGAFTTITGTTITASTSQVLNKGVPLNRIMKNNSGGALAAGDVVILDTTDNTGQSVTTTTTGDNPLVFGAVTTGGNDQADITICVSGYCGDVLKVDGTTNIAVGDPLSTFTTAKIAQKGSYGSGGVFAIALEAYTTDDYSGVIKAWIL